MAIATDCKSVLFGVQWFESTLPHIINAVSGIFYICGSSSFGRAKAFQALGGGFEPRLPLKSRCSSVVEYFLGKEGVTSSTLVNGSIVKNPKK